MDRKFELTCRKRHDTHGSRRSLKHSVFLGCERPSGESEPLTEEREGSGESPKECEAAE